MKTISANPYEPEATSPSLSILASAAITLVIAAGALFAAVGTAGAQTATTTAPTISEISTTSADEGQSEIVAWTTDLPASSQVYYGTSSFYGANTPYDSDMLTSHSAKIYGLSPGTVYHFKIESIGSGGLAATTSDMTFTTATSSAGNSDDQDSDQEDIDELRSRVTDLENQVAALQASVQHLADQIQHGGGDGDTGGGDDTGGDTGTSTPGTATVTPSGITIMAGSIVDFNGRGFGHEENVRVTMDGNTVTTAHADGGGNFSTGALAAPWTAGPLTYTFTGLESGRTATASVTVMSNGIGQNGMAQPNLTATSTLNAHTTTTF